MYLLYSMRKWDRFKCDRNSFERTNERTNEKKRRKRKKQKKKKNKRHNVLCEENYDETHFVYCAKIYVSHINFAVAVAVVAVAAIFERFYVYLCSDN